MNNDNDEIKKIIDELKLKGIADETDTNKKQTILTRYELECMLPDYIFGKLDDAEKEKFEGAIVSFPELEQEVNDAQEVFANLETFDYKALIKDKNQYLPDRVVASLEQQGTLYKEWQPNKKRLVGFAVLSLALLALLYFHNSYFDVGQEIAKPLPVQSVNTAAIFTELEKELLAEEIEENDFIEMLGYTPYYVDDIDHDLYSLFTDVDSNFYDMVYSDFDSYNEINSVMSTVPDYDYDMLIRWADDVDESMFQELLDDIHDS